MSTYTSQLKPRPEAACRRDGARYDIEASCRFWWTALVEQSHFGCGRMSNLSVGGVSVDSAILPHVGSSIMLEIDLPRAAHVGGAEDSYLLLSAEGKVLRHHPRGDGFAARITHASFATNQEAISE